MAGRLVPPFQRSPAVPRRSAAYKPILKSLVDSDRFNAISIEAAHLYVLLLLKVDDQGVYHAGGRRLLGELYDRRHYVGLNDVTRWLEELATTGLARFYEAEGGDYLQITQHYAGRCRKDRDPLVLHPPPADQPAANGQPMVNQTATNGQPTVNQRLQIGHPKALEPYSPRAQQQQDRKPKDVAAVSLREEKNKEARALLLDCNYHDRPVFSTKTVDEILEIDGLEPTIVARAIDEADKAAATHKLRPGGSYGGYLIDRLKNHASYGAQAPAAPDEREIAREERERRRREAATTTAQVEADAGRRKAFIGTLEPDEYAALRQRALDEASDGTARAYLLQVKPALEAAMMALPKEAASESATG